MAQAYLSSILAALATDLGNHLWQSTACLAVAGSLTLLLRKNQARARYGLWLTASVKFLLPFSLLIALGAHLAPPRAVATDGPGFYLTMQEVSQPFSQRPQAAESRAPTGLARQQDSRIVGSLPGLIAAVWLGGFLLVLAAWWRRWRHVTQAVRGARPLANGREVRALRRVERRAGMKERITILLSRSSLEPGIMGIARPVLVWPAGISDHLEEAHLEAILAHEVWHVRRRDNLAAAVHMLVEALFWFHPLVWWLGARLVEERERACDEAVLALGGGPQVYAESILKTCQFCLESPLACVSGITGAELKQRIVRIMTNGTAGKLSFSKRLILTTVGIAVVVGPMIFGLLNAPQIRAQAATTTNNGPLPAFEVASVKPSPIGSGNTNIHSRPGTFMATATVKALVGYAYDVQNFQISGGPGWFSAQEYQIDAKEEDSLVAEARKLPPYQREQQIRRELQSFLADRFKLQLSREKQELPVYALIVAKRGPKLQATKDDHQSSGANSGADAHRRSFMDSYRRGQLTGQSASIGQLAGYLSRQLGRTVLDQTGLTGRYDFSLNWSPEQNTGAMFRAADSDSRGPGSDSISESAGPSLFTALQEQLGLRLESTKGPVDIIVIDHIERPSAN